MTSNAGTEYINLKQAKYNRNMSQKRVNASRPTAPKESYAVRKPEQRQNRAVRSQTTHFSYYAPMPAHNAGEAAYASPNAGLSRTGSNTLTDGLWTDIADSVGKAIAAKRKAKARERASEAKYVKKRVKAATPFPISLVGYMVVFAAIAMFLVLGNTRINEATLRADTLKSSLAAEKERSEMLSSALSERKDIGYIEDYAENVLGMVKSTDVAKHYVRISGEDKIAVHGAVLAPETVLETEN